PAISPGRGPGPLGRGMPKPGKAGLWHENRRAIFRTNPRIARNFIKTRGVHVGFDMGKRFCVRSRRVKSAPWLCLRAMRQSLLFETAVSNEAFWRCQMFRSLHMKLVLILVLMIISVMAVVG